MSTSDKSSSRKRPSPPPLPIAHADLDVVLPAQDHDPAEARRVVESWPLQTLAAALLMVGQQLRERATYIHGLQGRSRGYSPDYTTFGPVISRVMAAEIVERISPLIAVADLIEGHLPRGRFVHSRIRVAGVDCEMFIGEGGDRGIAPSAWVRIAREIVLGQWDGSPRLAALTMMAPPARGAA